jgi:hypothetical protein
MTRVKVAREGYERSCRQVERNNLVAEALAKPLAEALSKIKPTETLREACSAQTKAVRFLGQFSGKSTSLRIGTGSI